MMPGDQAILYFWGLLSLTKAENIGSNTVFRQYANLLLKPRTSKGIFGKQSIGKPFEVNRKIEEEKLRIPINQMIFVGDGYTDIPCFSLINKFRGVPIGVYDKVDQERWGKAWGFTEEGRVLNLVPADYGKNSALSNSLIMAIDSIAGKINLRSHTYQG